MPTDLLSLALAAAMPLAAFALYAGLRSMSERRGRRPVRSRPGRSVRAERTSPAAPAPNMPIDAVGAPVAAGRGPQPVRAVAPVRMLAKLPVSRPAAASGNGHAPTPPIPTYPIPTPTASTSRVDRSIEIPLEAAAEAPIQPRPPVAPRPELAARLAEPVATRPDPVAGSSRNGVERVNRSESATPGRWLSDRLRPIRAVLRLEPDERRPVEPSWPDPDRLEGAFTPVGAISDGSGPCPYCAKSRERDAWFCRRCRRPLDARASAATAAVSIASAERPPMAQPMTAGATTADAGMRGSPTSTPTLQPAPLIARLPVVRPTQYIPATRRAGGTVGAGPVSSTPAPASAPVSATPPAAPIRPAVEMGGTPPTRPVVRPTAVVARQPSAARPTNDAARPTNDAEQPPPAPARYRARTNRAGLVAVGPGRPANGHRINLNRATAEQLSALRGVGPVTAERIVAAREEGPFSTVDALADRRIVGRAIVEKLHEQVTV